MKRLASKLRETVSRGLPRERWRKFMFPYGTKRMLSPKEWEWRDRILVFGELLAFGAAIAAIPAEYFNFANGQWLIVVATVVGTAALLWYAFDLISAGETPLTNRSARNIRQVISALEMETEGVVFHWDNIRQDGGIPADYSNWAKLRPDLKAIMDNYNVPLLVAAQILRDQETAETNGE